MHVLETVAGAVFPGSRKHGIKAATWHPGTNLWLYYIYTGACETKIKSLLVIRLLILVLQAPKCGSKY